MVKDSMRGAVVQNGTLDLYLVATVANLKAYTTLQK